jgi:hypothetical protein
MEQAIGRFDRHGQAFDVESIEIILDGSVQDYLAANLTKKSKATCLAQLTDKIFATVYDSDRGEDTTVDPIYKVDGRYLFKEQLQQEAPELVDVLEPIRVTELVDLFQELGRGQCSLSKDGWKDDTWTRRISCSQPTSMQSRERSRGRGWRRV